MTRERMIAIRNTGNHTCPADNRNIWCNVCPVQGVCGMNRLPRLAALNNLLNKEQEKVEIDRKILQGIIDAGEGPCPAPTNSWCNVCPVWKWCGDRPRRVEEAKKLMKSQLEFEWT